MLLASSIQMNGMKIAKSPERQFPEPFELIQVVTAQTFRVERLRRLFQFDKGASGLGWLGKGDVGTANAAFTVFRQHARRNAHALLQQGFDQRLESRRE